MAFYHAVYYRLVPCKMCNTCGSNISVAAGGANDIVEIDHLSLTENVLQGYH